MHPRFCRECSFNSNSVEWRVSLSTLAVFTPKRSGHHFACPNVQTRELRLAGKHNVINGHTQSHTNIQKHTQTHTRRSLNLKNWPSAGRARNSLYLFGGAAHILTRTKQHSHTHKNTHTHAQASKLIFKWVKLIKHNFAICDRALSASSVSVYST